MEGTLCANWDNLPTELAGSARSSLPICKDYWHDLICWGSRICIEGQIEWTGWRASGGFVLLRKHGGRGRAGGNGYAPGQFITLSSPQSLSSIVSLARERSQDVINNRVVVEDNEETIHPF